MAKGELVEAVEVLTQRIDQLEHQAELLKTVLIVKEPGAIISANAFEGLRKQIIASANDRLTHLSQIVQMRVAIDRASSLDDLKSMVTFKPLNLMGDWPMRGGFDIIFCRNVMIYFDQPTRDKLVHRFSSLLPEGGCLCVGHSESIHAGTAPVRLVSRTIYRKT